MTRGVKEIELTIATEDRCARRSRILVCWGDLRALAFGVALIKRDLILGGSLALKIG
ncbi:MAG: hypothetical protein AAFR19_02095 [Pseudomonadota bacterium]